MIDIKIEEEFNQYIQGSNELYLWKISLKNEFESGKKINKTKYQKICSLYDKRREEAKRLLVIINRLNSRVVTCMPPHYPSPPVPPKQPTRRNNYGLSK